MFARLAGREAHDAQPLPHCAGHLGLRSIIALRPRSTPRHAYVRSHLPLGQVCRCATPPEPAGTRGQAACPNGDAWPPLRPDRHLSEQSRTAPAAPVHRPRIPNGTPGVRPFCPNGAGTALRPRTRPTAAFPPPPAGDSTAGARRPAAVNVQADAVARQFETAARAARAAAAELARAPRPAKDAALTAAAAALRAAHTRDPRRQRRRPRRRRRPRPRLPRPPRPEPRPDRGHGRRPGAGRRAARPGRAGFVRMDTPERPPHPPRRAAHRRDRHDLREPPQRHGRRRRALPEVGQRGDPARRLGKPPQRRRHPRLHRPGPARGRAAGGRRAGRAHRRPRLRRRHAARLRPDRPDRAARRQGPGRPACWKRRACPSSPMPRGSATPTSTQPPTPPWRASSSPTPRCAAPASAARPRPC